MLLTGPPASSSPSRFETNDASPPTLFPSRFETIVPALPFGMAVEGKEVRTGTAGLASEGVDLGGALRDQARAVLALAVGLAVMLAFFLGGTGYPNGLAGNLAAVLVDFDGAPGPATVSSALRYAASSPSIVGLGWRWLDPTTTTPADLQARLDRGEFYMAVFVAPNATANLLVALGVGSAAAAAAYDPAAALSALYDEGRSGLTISTLLRTAQLELNFLVGAYLRSALLPTALASAGLNPAVALTPVTLTVANIHPVSPPMLQTAIALPFTLIMVFGLALAMLTIRSGNGLVARGARPDHVMLWMLAVAFPSCVVLGLLYPTFAVAFGASFSSTVFVAWWFYCVFLFVVVRRLLGGEKAEASDHREFELGP